MKNRIVQLKQVLTKTSAELNKYIEETETQNQALLSQQNTAVFL